MADAASATPIPEDAQPLSQVARVVNTFIEPSSTFKDIKRNRSWWLPFLILALLGYGFCYAAVQHIGWESLTTNVLRSQPKNAERLDKSTPAQAAQMLAFTKGIMEGFMVASPAVILLLNVIVALLLWFGFSFILGGTTNFAEMFAVAIFGALPNALNSIIAAVTAMVAEPQTYNLNVPSPAALASFLDPSAAPWLLSIAKSLDIFSLWAIALTGFGAGIVAKVKPARGIALVFAFWFIYVLIKTGLAAAFS